MRTLVEGDVNCRKRVKYSNRVCAENSLECRRRKIRCSGDQPCRGCRTSRSRICAYRSDHTSPATWNGLIPRFTQASHDQGINLQTTHGQLVDQLSPRFGVMLDGRCDPTVQKQTKNPPNSSLINSELVPQPYLRSELPLFSTLDYVSSKLFPNKHLGATLRLCFEELELYYPCIDRADFYDRLSDLFLLHSICQGTSTRIPIDAEHLSFAALTCMLLAIGTYLGADGPLTFNASSQTDDYFRQTSLLWYAESTTLLSKFESAEYPNLDLLRYHLLESIYMTMLGRRGGMSRSLALAVDLAYSLGINDEQTWSNCTIRQREYRRILWWTLVYMDCRIALSFERQLFLRHTGFNVGEFTEISFAQYMQDGGSSPQPHMSGVGILRLPFALPAKPPENYSEWLSFSMRWSKVVARVWDATSSLRATQDLAESIEMADSSLTEIQKTLPSSLRWNAGHLPSSIKTGDMDRACRFKIIVFEAMNVVRMSVRCAWLCNGRSITGSRDYEDATRMAETLTVSVMNAVVTYLTLRNYARPWSTYASSLLVRLSSKVAPILRARHALSGNSCSLIASMRNAQACLQELATAKLFAAKDAFTMLTRMLEGLQLPYSETIPRFLHEPVVAVLEDEADSQKNLLCGQSDGHYYASEAIWENIFSLG